MRFLNSNIVDLERIKTLRNISMVVLGLAVGVLSALLGIGGGSLMVPSLVYLFGLSQHRAHGTSLAFMAPVALFASIFYSRYDNVNWMVAVELAVGGVIGAAIGARLSNMLSARKLRLVFGLLLCLVGIRMLYELRYALAAAAAHGPMVVGYEFQPENFVGAIVVLLIGVFTGAMSGLLGIGGGIIMVPTLALLFGYDQRLAQGISLAVVIPVSLSGSLIHTLHGNVRWNMAFWLAAGGIAGGWIGASLANVVIGESVLRAIFGLLMLTMGILMARRGAAARSV